MDVSSEEIPLCYSVCLSSFKSLFALLSSRKFSNSFNTEKALDQYVRLRAWGEESRAILPAASRGSLDDVLRRSPAMKPTITSVLERINRKIHQAMQVMWALDESLEDLEGANNLYIDDSSGTDTSSEEADVHNPQTSAKTRQWSKIFGTTAEDIDLLYEVLLLITRPNFNRHYLHSQKPDEEESSAAMYAEFDVRHVEDKIRSWERSDSSNTEQRSAAAIEEVQTLALRLAKANTRRREQLKHWSKYPDQHPTNRAEPERKAHSQLVIDDPESKGKGVASSKSVMSTDTFTTTSVSDIFQAETVAGPPRTVYTDSTVGSEQSNRVPKVPSISLYKEHFECPYCHLDLDSARMQSRIEWKRHVYRDLRPYLCTFVDCKTPDKLYTSRRDWMYHEMQMHRQQWVCKEHHESFPTRKEFIDHIAVGHTQSVSHQQQINVLVELSERQPDDMDIVPCPLCPEVRRLKIAYSHVAQHLESIALFVLPGNEEEENIADEDLSSNSHLSVGYQSSGASSEDTMSKPGVYAGEPSLEEDLAKLDFDPTNTSPMRPSERYEHEKDRITSSLFSKRFGDNDSGPFIESYITHIRVTKNHRQIRFPLAVVVKESNPRTRFLIIAVKRDGRVSLHQARDNANGSLSIRRTWHLLDITAIDNFVHKKPKDDDEAQQILSAGETGFTLYTNRDENYWEANSATEKKFFLLSLLKIREKYVHTMDRSPESIHLPLLLGFSNEELDEIDIFDRSFPVRI